MPFNVQIHYNYRIIQLVENNLKNYNHFVIYKSFTCEEKNRIGFSKCFVF